MLAETLRCRRRKEQQQAPVEQTDWLGHQITLTSGPFHPGKRKAHTKDMSSDLQR